MGSTRDRTNSCQMPQDKDMQIYVGNLSMDTNEETLQEVFMDFDILSLRIVSGPDKRFAFLLLKNDDSICRAVRKMNRFLLCGRLIVVRAVNRELQRKVEGDRNSSTGGLQHPPARKLVFKKEEEDYPPALEAVLRPYRTEPPENKDMPPVLELVCDIRNVQDLPPPLELAFNNENVQDDDLPPRLESLFSNASPTSPFPIVDCYPATLVVANFPWGTTEDDLLFMFQDYFPLKVSVILNSRVPNSKEMTYAYVTVPNKDYAESAIVEMDNTFYKNRPLLITYILERIPSA